MSVVSQIAHWGRLITVLCLLFLVSYPILDFCMFKTVVALCAFQQMFRSWPAGICVLSFLYWMHYLHDGSLESIPSLALQYRSHI